MNWGLIHLSKSVTTEQLRRAVAGAFDIDAGRVYAALGRDIDSTQEEWADVVVAVLSDPDPNSSYPITFILTSLTGFPIPDDLSPVVAIVDHLGGHALAMPEAQGIYEHFYYVAAGRSPIEVEFDDEADDPLVLTQASLARIEAEAA